MATTRSKDAMRYKQRQKARDRIVKAKTQEDKELREAANKIVLSREVVQQVAPLITSPRASFEAGYIARLFQEALSGDDTAGQTVRAWLIQKRPGLWLFYEWLSELALWSIFRAWMTEPHDSV